MNPGRSKRYIYPFEEADPSWKDLFGGKGANLSALTQAGVRVPPGFVISTEACRLFTESSGQLPDEFWRDLFRHLEGLEGKTGRGFGSEKEPLLVSVRSGAKFSMPGMMDTILNLGLNDKTVTGFSEKTGDRWLALDSYRRFIQTFSDVVMGVKKVKFEEVLSRARSEDGVKDDAALSINALSQVLKGFKEIVSEESGSAVPDDPREQLKLAVIAVFKSWDNPRAQAYRECYAIPHDLGTAVNVQAMVFGNRGEHSCTGVAFSRDPSTGENKIFGEFLPKAQGEDVVAGVRTPIAIEQLDSFIPGIKEELFATILKIESHFGDMQDIEFTVEEGCLFILQTRAGKRTGRAAVKIAVDLFKEGAIGKKEAILRVEPGALDQLLHPSIDESKEYEILAAGLNASPGAAFGKIALSTEEVEERTQAGEKVILVREETNPNDIRGIFLAEGVLTARGGMTSHAAVVTRGIGKPCVVGCSDITFGLNEGTVEIKGVRLGRQDTITIDGTSGRVFRGTCDVVPAKIIDEFQEFLSWADEFKRLGVRANADTPEDALRAYEFGAQGIGLCRTEHMFMAQERLPEFQAMILSDNRKERERHLAKIQEMQERDFEAIFREMKGYPVTVRLLDPPLHEFLPKDEEALESLLRQPGLMSPGGGKSNDQVDRLKNRAASLREANPMLGFRGCRLGILYPEINEMQVRAIFRAASRIVKAGEQVQPEIMIPLVGHVNELSLIRDQLEAVAAEEMKIAGVSFPYLFGTMIEVPRAAITADEIAEVAHFFSFGTNDLTQMTLAISRDDAEEKFLRYYIDKKIYPNNPFETIDRKGVGTLMKMAVEKGRKARSNIKLGICGEHGGDPDSIRFCEEIGLDYVSCSPYRVPIARLAAAQAAIFLKDAFFESETLMKTV